MAPLINFQTLFSNKVFYRLKLFRKFKFYTWMTIFGRKSVKKDQKMTKIWFITSFPFFLSWLIWNILMAIIWWKIHNRCFLSNSQLHFINFDVTTEIFSSHSKCKMGYRHRNIRKSSTLFHAITTKTIVLQKYLHNFITRPSL